MWRSGRSRGSGGPGLPGRSPPGPLAIDLGFDAAEDYLRHEPATETTRPSWPAAIGAAPGTRHDAYLVPLRHPTAADLSALPVSTAPSVVRRVAHLAAHDDVEQAIVDVTQIFDHPTPAGLAELVRAAATEPAIAPLPRTDDNPVQPASSAQDWQSTWQRATPGTVTVVQGSGRHVEMMAGDHAAANARLIRSRESR